MKEYENEAKGVEVISNPEGWHMRVKPDVLPKVAHLTPYSDLKDGHKRTLALVVYKEPVKQSEVVHIQGNKAYAYVKFLRKKGLIKAEKEGRTSKLMATKELERYFGMEKARIKEMLMRAMEAEKAKKAELKQEVKPAAKQEIKGQVKAEVKPAAATPPTNFQYIEVKPAALVEKRAETKAATKPETRKVIRRSRKATPASKIGTRRPA